MSFITKAILSSAFQFQSQYPSFICITETNSKQISARVRLIMTSVKVFSNDSIWSGSTQWKEIPFVFWFSHSTPDNLIIAMKNKTEKYLLYL